MTDVWITDLCPFSPESGDSPVPVPLHGHIPGVLSEAETERADSFPVRREGRRFAASRFFLRSVLSEYTGRPAGELEFRSGPGGKPALVAGPPELCFNLSHSGDVAVLAVAGAEVGVDIEEHRRLRDLDLLVEYAFAPEEAALLRELPGGAREEVFFRAWCVKEAVIKARGERAALYLDRIKVVTPCRGREDAEAAEVCFEEAFTWEAELYRARLIDILPGYSAAVCLCSSRLDEVRIHRFRWPSGD
jgi:4'-phosphopantetheinyl transferase